MTLIWKNIREGDDYLLISTDDRFVVKRAVVGTLAEACLFRYTVSDLVKGKTEPTDTLQEARRIALRWAEDGL